MIRWVAPSVETAEALMPQGECSACGGVGRSLVRYGVVTPTGAVVKNPVYRPCPDCSGTGETPPALTWIVADGDMPKAVTFHPDCTASYAPDPPSWFVRAVESGERIEITVECARCEGNGVRRVDGGLFSCSFCGERGLVVVGTVVATACLPIVGLDGCNNDEHVCVLGDERVRHHHKLPPAHYGGETEFDITAALSVYGDPASLVGRFAVLVTDTRPQPRRRSDYGVLPQGARTAVLLAHEETAHGQAAEPTVPRDEPALEEGEAPARIDE